jgi:CTP-dependent riboflavin kinase
MTFAMVLSGTVRLSEDGKRRTAGQFSNLILDNAEIFRRYFGFELFPGSLNVDIPDPSSLQAELDSRRPAPSIVIPKTLLINMPEYIGDGQAWPCRLKGAKFPMAVECWIFRRIGSRVPPGVIELVAREKLRETHKLRHGDKVTIEVLEPCR